MKGDLICLDLAQMRHKLKNNFVSESKCNIVPSRQSTQAKNIRGS